jgi:hypothetical protein
MATLTAALMSRSNRAPHPWHCQARMRSGLGPSRLELGHTAEDPERFRAIRVDLRGRTAAPAGTCHSLMQGEGAAASP